jgi:thiamine biosynthesis lipoprotein
VRSRLDRGELSLRDAHSCVVEVLEHCERLRRATAGAFDVRAAGRLDPSGYVKGWSVDRAAAMLAAAGARNYCVDAGGDLVVRGGADTGRGWRVGIRPPGRPDRVVAVLELTDAAVATSGAYERGDHVVDPRTGRPPRGTVAVTISDRISRPPMLARRRPPRWGNGGPRGPGACAATRR